MGGVSQKRLECPQILGVVGLHGEPDQNGVGENHVVHRPFGLGAVEAHINGYHQPPPPPPPHTNPATQTHLKGVSCCPPRTPPPSHTHTHTHTHRPRARAHQGAGSLSTDRVTPGTLTGFRKWGNFAFKKIYIRRKYHQNQTQAWGLTIDGHSILHMHDGMLPHSLTRMHSTSQHSCSYVVCPCAGTGTDVFVASLWCTPWQLT